MKLSLLVGALLVAEASGNALCTSHSRKNDCQSASGCYWVATGNGQTQGSCHAEETNETEEENHPETTTCNANANNANQCEGDNEDCIFVNDKGTKTCTEVNRGTAGDGELCQMYLNDDDGVDIWMEKENHGCQPGFICTLNDDFLATSIDYGVDVTGTCVPTSCNGKKVPGNCNGNIANKDQCEATTQRVTICHRTCSAKNPWVRITIDEDAWSGQGCGHQLQHDIRDECANKAPWTEWGPNRMDHLIKFHGTRQHVADINNFNANEEREYWRIWEPACPSVRNGKCCDWTDENPCCGVPPEDLCPFDMGDTGDSICPPYEAVTTLGVKVEDEIIPDGFSPSDMFYDMVFGGSAVAPTVSFKINPPFDFATDTYLQYHKVAAGSSQGALDPDCIAYPLAENCVEQGTPATAGCIVPPDGGPAFTIVSVFFISSNSLFGYGGNNVDPYECCPIPPEDANSPIVEYKFKVLCECPESESRRKLRGDADPEHLRIWEEFVGTGH